jgi:hypothetical protein
MIREESKEIRKEWEIKREEQRRRGSEKKRKKHGEGTELS